MTQSHADTEQPEQPGGPQALQPPPAMVLERIRSYGELGRHIVARAHAETVALHLAAENAELAAQVAAAHPAGGAADTKATASAASSGGSPAEEPAS